MARRRTFFKCEKSGGSIVFVQAKSPREAIIKGKRKLDRKKVICKYYPYLR